MEKYYQTHSDEAKVNPGKLWRAGKSIYGLCAAWNYATRPYIPLSDRTHEKASRYARAIKNRMRRLGYSYGIHYKDFSNGMLWPIENRE